MMRSCSRLLPAVSGMAPLAASPAPAFQHQEYRADDDTAYQVLGSIAPVGGGADHERITSMAGAQSLPGPFQPPPSRNPAPVASATALAVLAAVFGLLGVRRLRRT